MSNLRERVAAATAAHHIDPTRTDADGHSFCVCGEWADGEMEPGWDDHMADVSAAVFAAWLRERAKHQRNLGALARVVSHQELTEDAARRYEALADEIERREASDGD